MSSKSKSLLHVSEDKEYNPKPEWVMLLVLAVFILAGIITLYCKIKV